MNPPIRLPTALTFDYGPSGLVTQDLLDILESGEAKATFFFVGSRMVTFVRDSAGIFSLLGDRRLAGSNG